MEELTFLLGSAQTYANNASTIFNFFLTVVFGSFAFAAALPLRNIGPCYQWKALQCSLSSLVMGGVLLSFYVISFVSYVQVLNNLETVLTKMQDMIQQHPELHDLSHLFAVQEKYLFDLDSTSIGFMIGSVGGLIIFMWVTNAERHT